MTTKPSNEPAFPTPLCSNNKDVYQIGYTGMTLRDYFAIHAPTEEISIMGFHYEQGEYVNKVIEARYRYADAMLLERMKNE